MQGALADSRRHLLARAGAPGAACGRIVLGQDHHRHPYLHPADGGRPRRGPALDRRLLRGGRREPAQSRRLARLRARRVRRHPGAHRRRRHAAARRGDRPPQVRLRQPPAVLPRRRAVAACGRDARHRGHPRAQPAAHRRHRRRGEVPHLHRAASFGGALHGHQAVGVGRAAPAAPREGQPVPQGEPGEDHPALAERPRGREEVDRAVPPRSNTSSRS